MAADLEGGSLHEALARAGLQLRRGQATITSEAATPDDARLLGVGAGEPLLVERRVIADVAGRPVEATESRYPGDRYALDVRFDVDDGGPDARPDADAPDRPARDGAPGSASAPRSTTASPTGSRSTSAGPG